MTEPEPLQPVEQVDEITGRVWSHVQTVPAVSWIIGHAIGQVPSRVVVTLDESGEAEVTANETSIVVTTPDVSTGKIEFA